MNAELKIGMIGLDTSHVVAFAKVLNDSTQEYHVPGGRIVCAWPGGSPDFELSRSRVEGFTKELKEKFGIEILASPEDVARRSDAVLLESVDGRVHFDQFRRIAALGKPTFIDKPFAVASKDARALAELARRSSAPLMSCSALRYAEGLSAALGDARNGAIIGADFFGPMSLEPTQPGLFWYGIHSVEMLFTVLGKGCVSVAAFSNDLHDMVVGQWADGRVGVIRGNRKGNPVFGGTIHRERGSQFVDVQAHPKPYYASMLERILEFFKTRTAPVDLDETIEIVRFIEAANESRPDGKPIRL